MNTTIIAIIEKSEQNNIAVRAKDIKGVYGMGSTEYEAREDFEEVLKEQAEFYFSQYEEWPQWREYKIEYRYDFSAFFDIFPFVNITKFAEEVGINPSLMGKYKNRLAYPSEKQKQLIQEKFEDILQRFTHVLF